MTICPKLLTMLSRMRPVRSEVTREIHIWACFHARLSRHIYARTKQ